MGKEVEKKMKLLKKKQQVEKTVGKKIKKDLVKKKKTEKYLSTKKERIGKNDKQIIKEKKKKKNKEKKSEEKKKKKKMKKKKKEIKETEVETEEEHEVEAEEEHEEEIEEEHEEEIEEEHEEETEEEHEEETKEEHEVETTEENKTEKMTDVLKSKKQDEDFFDNNNVFLHFENTVLDVRLRKSLLYIFQFKHPTKIQSYAIPQILKGNDVFINSKTGSGKTLAYLIPAIQKLIKLNINEKEHLKFFYKCIIIAPTDILCVQIYQIIQKLCKYLKDLVTVSHNVNTLTIDYSTILVSTPKNLFQYIIEKRKKQNIDILSNLKVLIIDEADVLHNADFKRCMDKLKQTFPKSLSQKFQVIMASATLKKSIVKDSEVLLHNPVFVKLDGSIINLEDGEMNEQLFERNKKNRNGCNQENQTEEGGKKKEKITSFNGNSFYYTYDENLTRCIILYCLFKKNIIPFRSVFFTTTIRSAYFLKVFLAYFNISSVVLHPKYSSFIRQSMIDIFNKGKILCLICPQYQKNIKNQPEEKENYIYGKKETKRNQEQEQKQEKEEKEKKGKEKNDDNNNNNDRNDDDEDENDENIWDDEDDKDFLFHRGLDYQEMKCVINFDMALNKETFLHRIGRTCRLVSDGTAISFINEKDQLENEVLQTILKENIAKMEHRNDLSEDIESYRYRVESVFCKCTNVRIAKYMSAEAAMLRHNSKKIQNSHLSGNEAQTQRRHVLMNIGKNVLLRYRFGDINNSFYLIPYTSSFKNNRFHRWNKKGQNNRNGYSIDTTMNMNRNTNMTIENRN